MGGEEPCDKLLDLTLHDSDEVGVEHILCDLDIDPALLHWAFLPRLSPLGCLMLHASIFVTLYHVYFHI